MVNNREIVEERVETQEGKRGRVRGEIGEIGGGGERERERRERVLENGE